MLCYVVLLISEKIPWYGKCTFENSACGWHNLKEVPKKLQGGHPAYNWTLHRGQSLYKHSGPTRDHTTMTEMGKQFLCYLYNFIIRGLHADSMIEKYFGYYTVLNL